MQTEQTHSIDSTSPSNGSSISSNTSTNSSTTSTSSDKQCRICGKVYTRGSDLKRHEQSQHGAKSYHCHFCGKLFSRSDTLTRHVKNQCKGKLSSIQIDLIKNTHLRESWLIERVTLLEKRVQELEMVHLQHTNDQKSITHLLNKEIELQRKKQDLSKALLNKFTYTNKH